MRIPLRNILVLIALISVMSDIPNDTDVVCILWREGGNNSFGFPCECFGVLGV